MTDDDQDPTDTLVIGYGSDLRGDDAAGRRAVERVADRGLPGVRVLSLAQLAPELAEDLTTCGRAVFVDASVSDTAVTVRSVAPAPPSWRLTHSVAPSSLLALAAAMGHAPAADVVTIPAVDLGLSLQLSPATAAHVDEAVERIVALCAVPDDRQR